MRYCLLCGRLIELREVAAYRDRCENCWASPPRRPGGTTPTAAAQCYSSGLLTDDLSRVSSQPRGQWRGL